MKKENQERRELRNALTIALILLPLTFGCHRGNDNQVQKSTDTLVFEGTVECLGPDPGIGSGILAVYRLVKYRVERVVVGEYAGREIVVDHPIFSGDELKGFSVTDRVCVTVEISPKILQRWDAEGIRNPGEEVKTFYIAAYVTKLPGDGSSQCEAQ
jgi:hypothetical protein